MARAAARDGARLLLVFSYIRWGFAWQRPQQLASRFARESPVVFVEEPWPDEVDEPRLRSFDEGSVSIVRLDVPDPGRFVGFGDPCAARYPSALCGFLKSHEASGGLRRVALLGTPMAMGVADAVGADLLVYDAMDSLADFLGAPAGLRERERELLATADVAFTGGRSLYEARRGYRDGPLYCFPSGVEPEHYAAVCAGRKPGSGRPVAGFVGVIDERMDLRLVAGLAEALSDWDIHLVGPVVKIEPASLPRAANLHYLGFRPYHELPDAMAALDVAIMPFADNPSTRQISPTKTLEYLAAGLPVVSTPVPDVIYEYGHVVTVTDGTPGFADACRRMLDPSQQPDRAAVSDLLRDRHWDRIAEAMQRLMSEALAARP